MAGAYGKRRLPRSRHAPDRYAGGRCFYRYDALSGTCRRTPPEKRPRRAPYWRAYGGYPCGIRIVSGIALKGMTWSHPRGYDPMVACAQDWLEQTGVSIEWDKRSLQDFESFPVEELARRYDLIVIDHPH